VGRCYRLLVWQTDTTGAGRCYRLPGAVPPPRSRPLGSATAQVIFFSTMVS
ncbi:unnamed protein product, partial [Musa textilis]